MSSTSHRRTALLVATLAAVPAAAQHSEAPVIGRWDLTVAMPNGPASSWLEVLPSGNGYLVGRFVGTAGSARPVSRVRVSGDSLRFAVPPQWESGTGDLQVEGALAGDRLSGTMVLPDGQHVTWTGVRAPDLVHPTPAWGAPIALFNGRDLGGWTPRGQKNNWHVANGLLTNDGPGANLVTTARFGDFKLHAEFRYPKGSNSGMYLRGRYEVQIEDSPPRVIPRSDEMGGVYGFLAPNASAARPAGEWQTYDITLVGRRITVVLNGRTVIADQLIPGITGEALDSDEGAPGPIYIQGTEGAVEFRKLVLTPAARTTGAAGGGAGGDTTRYAVLFSDRPAGYYREVRRGGDLRSVFEYNDRGRGPHIEFTTRVDARGVPTSFEAVGHAYLKDTVAERFTMSADSAVWRNTTEHGARAHPGRAFYVSASGSPAELLLLVRAALAGGGRVPLLPNGEATVERVGARTVTVAGVPVRLAQYALSGLGFEPLPVWLEEGGDRFASVSGWFSIVPEGWEAAIPELVRAQDRSYAARSARLARQLSHRPGGPLVIRGASLFVAESASVRPHTSVVVTGNRITAVGPDGSVPIPAGAQVIDGTGKTLLPGLWDMHVHGADGASGMLDIAAGITTARDMGDDTVQTLDARRKLNADSVVGPRLILAGLIDGSGPYQVPIGVLADDSATARRAVDWYAAHGYEQIKIYSSMKPELVPVIVAAAKAHGLRVSGHVPAYMTAAQVVSAGYDEVQHANMLLLNFMDSVRDTRSMARFTAIAEHGAELDLGAARVQEFVALFRSRGVDIDPTLVAFEGMFTARPGELDPSQRAIADRMPPQVRRGFYAGGLPVPPGRDQRYRDGFGAMLRITKAMYDAGVPIVAGTDAFPSGFALHRELELYVAAGIPAPAVLQLATLGAARVMHHDDDRGTVGVGKLADLVLVSGDPTKDIADVRRTALVVKDGIVFRPAEIYQALGVRP